MLKHHEDSIKIMVDYYKNQPGVIAVILGGSVAKDCARPDSDIDGYIVVSEEIYSKRAKENHTIETLTDMCTYKEGYFDVKYMTKAILKLAAEKASEPTRNSFISSKVLYTQDPEIETIVSQIPVFQEKEFEEKMLSFYSNFWLNTYYFWKGCHPHGYMKIHTVNEIIYSVYRMILQENKILFPSNRRLEEFVDKAPSRPKDIVKLASAFIHNLDDPSCDAFINAYLNWSSFKKPEDVNQILSRYSTDYEQWWRTNRPQMGEW